MTLRTTRRVPAAATLLLLATSLAAAAPSLRSPALVPSQTAGTKKNTAGLGATGCFAPRSEGGWGYCGPPSCKDAYVTCPSAGAGPATVDGVAGSYVEGYSASACSPFVPRTSTPDITDWTPPGGGCDSTCIQRTTGVCSAEFLADVLKGDGVKTAHCNDK